MPPYAQLIGDLEAKHGVRSPTVSRAVFSDLVRGAAVSQPADGIWLKYVARGAVAHTFAGRTYLARAGEFLFAPEGLASGVEVRPGAEPSTIGLCVFVATGAPRISGSTVEEPVIFPARCSELGALLARETERMHRISHDREQRAAKLAMAVERNLELFLETTSRQLAALGDRKSSTRHETLRRLQRARAHLHGVMDRSVTLQELAQAAGLSRFHLLRQFKLVFGEPPGAYHRKLRLERAAQAVRRGGEAITVAAQGHGFADASSFSHAYRRAFGAAPFRPGRA